MDADWWRGGVVGLQQTSPDSQDETVIGCNSIKIRTCS